MRRRLFGRKKDDDEIEAPEDSEVEEQIEAEAAPEGTEGPSAEAEVETPTAPPPKSTIPYHATLQDRLLYLLKSPEMASQLEAPDEFKLEFMAMGERFALSKKPMGAVTITTGASPDEDAFIRIANDVVSELLSAAVFSEFSEVFLKYYKNAEPGKFVKIELRKPITELNRRGYARVPTLKLLIGAAR
jgi:hypothetical protein